MALFEGSMRQATVLHALAMLAALAAPAFAGDDYTLKLQVGGM